jgi:hypothetical protein
MMKQTKNGVIWFRLGHPGIPKGLGMQGEIVHRFMTYFVVIKK